MNSTPLLSVIIPVYNVEKYLAQCIESIINQTYSNIEIILINDGSADGSLEICESYARIDDRIKVIDQQNKGVSAARNLGVQICKGQYLSFVDADDFVNQDLYKKCSDQINSLSLPDLLFFGYAKVSQEGKILSVIIPELNFIDDIQNAKGILAKQLLCGAGTAVWDKIIKREFVIKHNIVFEDFKNGEDINYVFKLLAHAKSASFLNLSLYNYRLSMGGAVKRIDDNLAVSYIINYKNIYNFFKPEIQNELVSLYLKNTFLNWFTLVLPMYYSRFFKSNHKDGIKNLKMVYDDQDLMKYYNTVKNRDSTLKNKVFNLIFKIESPLLLLTSGLFFRFLRNKFKIVN